MITHRAVRPGPPYTDTQDQHPPVTFLDGLCLICHRSPEDRRADARCCSDTCWIAKPSFPTRNDPPVDPGRAHRRDKCGR